MDGTANFSNRSQAFGNFSRHDCEPARCDRSSSGSKSTSMNDESIFEDESCGNSVPFARFGRTQCPFQLAGQMRMPGAIDALDQESARGDLFEAEVSSIKQRSRLVGSTQLPEFVSANDFLNNTRGYECVSQPY